MSNIQVLWTKQWQQACLDHPNSSLESGLACLACQSVAELSGLTCQHRARCFQQARPRCSLQCLGSFVNNHQVKLLILGENSQHTPLAPTCDAGMHVLRFHTENLERPFSMVTAGCHVRPAFCYKPACRNFGNCIVTAECYKLCVTSLLAGNSGN